AASNRLHGDDSTDHPLAAGVEVLSTILERSSTRPVTDRNSDTDGEDRDDDSDSDADPVDDASLSTCVSIMQSVMAHPVSSVRRAGVHLAVALHRHTAVGRQGAGVYEYLPVENPELYKRRTLVKVYVERAVEKENAGVF
ncbi:hypothetical protein HDU93_009777, partial [Gonapodya sp. JEL0774]